MGMGHLDDFDETHRIGSTQDGLHADAALMPRTRPWPHPAAASNSHLRQCLGNLKIKKLKLVPNNNLFKTKFVRAHRNVFTKKVRVQEIIPPIFSFLAGPAAGSRRAKTGEPLPKGGLLRSGSYCGAALHRWYLMVPASALLGVRPERKDGVHPNLCHIERPATVAVNETPKSPKSPHGVLVFSCSTPQGQPRTTP